MGKLKQNLSKKGEAMHYSVGALIERDGKYLLIDRTNFPYGFAGLAGHIDKGENEQEALIREVKEESGLNVINSTLIFEEELDWNECSRGIKTHYWYLFKCETTGEIKMELKEEKSIGWYSKDQIKNLSSTAIGELKLEPVWEYWFRKMNII